MAERSWLPLGGRPVGWRAAVGRQQWDEWAEVMFKLLTQIPERSLIKSQLHFHAREKRSWNSSSGLAVGEKDYMFTSMY